MLIRYMSCKDQSAQCMPPYNHYVVPSTVPVLDKDELINIRSNMACVMAYVL